MTLNEAIDQISVHLGFRTDLTARATAALQQAQDQLERGPTYPWFLLTEEATADTADSERRVPVPADFIGEYEYDCLFYVPADEDEEKVPLKKYDLEYLDTQYSRTAEGPPETYAKVGNVFVLYPIPDDIYTLEMRYYAKDAAITSLAGADTNKWLTNAPYTIIGLAGQFLATGLRDMVAKDAFERLEARGRAAMGVQDVEQEVSNRDDLQMGGPEV